MAFPQFRLDISDICGTTLVGKTELLLKDFTNSICFPETMGKGREEKRLRNIHNAAIDSLKMKEYCKQTFLRANWGVYSNNL